MFSLHFEIIFLKFEQNLQILKSKMAATCYVTNVTSGCHGNQLDATWLRLIKSTKEAHYRPFSYICPIDHKQPQVEARKAKIHTCAVF